MAMTGWASYRVPYLPVGALLGHDELAAVARVLESGATLSCGAERERFEEEFAAYVGARYAVAVANCTMALELATHLIGLRPGDEVIATPQT
jgi:perosamine synthetase